jgi:hypothetical protein
MRAHWKYEMVDGTKGEVTTLPVDIVIAEKVTKSFLSQGVGFQFMTVAVHSALKRQAKAEGTAIVGYDEWIENLVELSDVDSLKVKDEDLAPFGDSETTPSREPSKYV